MGKQRPVLAGMMAAVYFVALYYDRVRPWMYTWGATRDEVGAVLPGDELVFPGRPKTTRAVTIKAPAKAVWPWLAQIGEHRAGFYSYSWLERLVGTRIHNAATIHPEWQELDVGQTIRLASRYGAAGRQVVAAVKPNSHVVLVSPADFERLQNGKPASAAWGFYLCTRDGQTRLLARTSGGIVGRIGFDVAHFVMEQRMLRRIRDLAQRKHESDRVTVLHRPRSWHRHTADPREHGIATLILHA